MATQMGYREGPVCWTFDILTPSNILRGKGCDEVVFIIIVLTLLCVLSFDPLVHVCIII